MTQEIFQKKKVWLFDLDNTIYSPHTKIFDQIDRRMKLFISKKLSVSEKEAFILQKKFYNEYGTTLYGLMKHHQFDPDEFLDFVHDIDLSNLKKNTELFDKINNLPGTKVIYTNGERNYAKKVLLSLGISDLFESIWDIKKSKFIPKPQMSPLKNLLMEKQFDSSYCVYFEDIKKNLQPAHQLGITTVHITENNSMTKDSYVDFRFKTIISALDMINKTF